MADVFTVLEADHLEVKSILSELIAGLSSPGDTTRLAEPAERLVIEESKHEAVEQMHFWPAVRQHLPNGDHLADQALSQENEGKEILDELRKADPDSAEFQTLIRTFATAGSEHISFEETRVWPELRSVLSPTEREELGSEIEQAKRSAPTRPHPHGPDSPGGLKTVGGVAAAADKVRDKLTDRG